MNVKHAHHSTPPLTRISRTARAAPALTSTWSWWAGAGAGCWVWGGAGGCCTRAPPRARPSARPATEGGAAPGPQAARSQVRNIVQLCGGGGAGSHFHNYCFKGILNWTCVTFRRWKILQSRYSRKIENSTCLIDVCFLFSLQNILDIYILNISAPTPGHLRVPLVRARGTSLPNGMEESLTKNNSYLLRQYNIKVVMYTHY